MNKYKGVKAEVDGQSQNSVGFKLDGNTYAHFLPGAIDDVIEIAHRWNSHEELIEALEKVKDDIVCFSASRSQQIRCIEVINLALQKIGK